MMLKLICMAVAGVLIDLWQRTKGEVGWTWQHLQSLSGFSFFQALYGVFSKDIPWACSSRQNFMQALRQALGRDNVLLHQERLQLGRQSREYCRGGLWGNADFAAPLCFLQGSAQTQAWNPHEGSLVPLCMLSEEEDLKVCRHCRCRKLHFFFKYLLASASVMCAIIVMLYYIPGFRPWNPM